MIVIDSSFFLSNIYADEESPLVLDVFGAIERSELTAFAPAIFMYEIHNSLLTAVRRKRMDLSQVPEYLQLLALAPVTIVETGSPGSIMDLAFSHGLSFYDASYLELAKRRNIPLATLDARLHDAAKEENVAYPTPG